MQPDAAMARQIENEHAAEREYLAHAKQCHTQGELKEELTALARLLHSTFAAREAPGGFLERAVNPGRVGSAQQATWDTVQQTLHALSDNDSVDPAQALESIAERLHTLQVEDDIVVLGPEDEEADDFA